MDCKGAWRDNVFVERLWRTIKCGRVYLQAYEAVSAARSDMDTCIDWYNRERVHSGIDGRTPEQDHWVLLPGLAVAAWNETTGVLRVAYRVDWFVAKRRPPPWTTQLCTYFNPHSVSLSLRVKLFKPAGPLLVKSKVSCSRRFRHWREVTHLSLFTKWTPSTLAR